MAQQLMLGGEKIEVVKTTRRGSIGLRVEPNRIALMVPKQFSDLTIESVLANEKDWLLEKIRQQKAVMPNKLELKSGHELLWFGEKVMFREEHKTPVKTITLSLENACITALCATQRSLKDPKLALRKKVVAFYTDALRQHLMQQVPYFAEQIGVEVAEVTIRNYKSRWGSCYPDGRIQFNWRLAMAPLEVVDYVIQHELCHLIHPNHSAEYWALVEAHCPDYDLHKKWLKENGAAIIAF